MENNDLYGIFSEVLEQQQKTNFNHFVSSLDSGLVKDLDRLYQEGIRSQSMKQYEETLQNVKNWGIKVLRNSSGKHKVKFI